ncbi:nucleoside deaminase [Daejeonella sp. H1SJ63]|jgi:tRNA(adenine34) deaminase|uniref:nucleoside deaminase n=1 Tax=Daejeonella sp. H1SJ63 TaxID=3034145 RepID=UPI0023EAD54F|nr:nucleoside deaminase [Daejeonella sp. H1SJ63]
MKYINFTDNPVVSPDEFFMNEALKEAAKALELDEVPIGAVVVHGGKIIGRGHNLTERLNDVTAHAEMQAFTAAANYVGAKYLKDCTLYVTIEPCVMCAGASYWTQISRIVYGAADEKRGFTSISGKILHPKTELISGILAEKSSQLVKDFFMTRRNKS